MTKPEETKHRPILSLLQILVIVVVLIAMGVTLSINARTRDSETLSETEAALATRVAMEEDRQRQLAVTLTYVSSDDYVADYARNEAGMLQDGEKRVVPMPNPVPPTPTLIPTPLPAVTLPETPLEAWWMLFFDSPPPGK